MVFSKSSTVLIILVVIFIVTRVLLLLFSIDKLLTVDFTKGYVAKEILSGNNLGLFNYQTNDKYQFGFHLIPLFVIPFFLSFGETYFSIKMVSLTLATGTLIFWFLFLNGVFDRKVAALSSLFYILCPFRLTISLFRTRGMNTDLCFFTALNIYFFYALFISQNHMAKKFPFLMFFIFGLFNGFSSGYGYIYLITLCCIFLFWNAMERNFFLGRRFFCFVVGFVMGLLPWFAFNVSNNFQGLILGGIRSGGVKLNKIFSLEYLFEKLPLIFLQQLPFAFWNEGLPLQLRKITSVFYYVVICVCFICLYFLNRKHLMAFVAAAFHFDQKQYPVVRQDLIKLMILVYPLLFFAIYLLTPFYKIRYLDVLMPFFFTGISWCVFQRNASKIFSLLKGGTVSIILVLGLMGNFNHMTWRHFGDIFKYRGYEYGEYGGALADIYARGDMTLAEAVSRMDKLNILDRHAAYASFAAHAIPQNYSPDYLSAFHELMGGINKKYQHYFYYHLGKIHCVHHFPGTLIKGLGALNDMDIRFADFFAKSYASTMGLMFNREDRGDINISMDQAIGCLKYAEEYWPLYKEYFTFGLGYAVGKLYSDNLLEAKDIEIVLKKINLQRNHKYEFYKGLGYGLCHEYIISPGYIMGSDRGEYPMDLKLFKSIAKLIDDIIPTLDVESYRAKFYEGVMIFWGEYWIKGIEDNYYGNIDIDVFINYFSKKDPLLISHIYKGAGEGMSRFAINYFESFEFNRLTREENFAKNIPAGQVNSFYEGLGEGYGSRYGFDSEAYEYVMSQIKVKKEKGSTMYANQ